MPAIDYLSIRQTYRKPPDFPELRQYADNPSVKALTRSQKAALASMLAGESCFNTGGAGTGKSFLIDAFTELARKDIVKCAPTGVAAINIGAQTIHGLFGLEAKLDVFTPEDCEAIRKRMKRSGNDRQPKHPLLLADALIIDEISMCRGDVFAMIMAAVRGINENRHRLSHKDKQPLQIVAVGDFRQLPPVLTDKPNIEVRKGKKTDIVSALDRYRELYGNASGFPFLCPEWDFRLNPLTEVKRQSDRRFAEALNRLRVGDASGLRWIEGNSAARPDPEAIWICGQNRKADQINRERLAAIRQARITFETGVQVLDPGMSRQEAMAYMRAACGQELELKEGCRVVAIANQYDEKRLVYANGQMGTVLAIDDDPREPAVTVRFDSGSVVDVRRKVWEVKRPTITVKRKKEELEDKMIAKISQFPLQLGYATTVHKSQGKTLDKVNIDENCNFAPGQLYVACSRCRDVKTLYLARKGMKPLVSEEVEEFEAAGGKSGRR